MAVLGLLIQRPGGPAHIRMRLDQEYSQDKWSRSIAYNTIRDLAEKGLIRKVRDGTAKSEDVYEPTDEGVSEFMAWASAAATTPPPERDPLLVWVEHSKRSELPKMLAVLKKLEEDTYSERDAAQVQMNQERRRSMFGPPDGSDWSGLMRYTARSQRVKKLGQRAEDFKKIALKIQNKGNELQLEEPNPDG